MHYQNTDQEVLVVEMHCFQDILSILNGFYPFKFIQTDVLQFFLRPTKQYVFIFSFDHKNLKTFEHKENHI